MAATILTTTQVADELDTDPRTLRKFLRSEDGLNTKVGKGQKWSIEARQVRSLKSRFAKWTAASAAKAEARAEAHAAETIAEDD